MPQFEKMPNRDIVEYPADFTPADIARERAKFDNLKRQFPAAYPSPGMAAAVAARRASGMKYTLEMFFAFPPAPDDDYKAHGSVTGGNIIADANRRKAVYDADKAEKAAKAAAAPPPPPYSPKSVKEAVAWFGSNIGAYTQWVRANQHLVRGE
jgi:hypothetical protein